MKINFKWDKIDAFLKRFEFQPQWMLSSYQNFQKCQKVRKFELCSMRVLDDLTSRLKDSLLNFLIWYCRMTQIATHHNWLAVSDLLFRLGFNAILRTYFHSTWTFRTPTFLAFLFPLSFRCRFLYISSNCQRYRLFTFVENPASRHKRREYHHRSIFPCKIDWLWFGHIHGRG